MTDVQHAHPGAAASKRNGRRSTTKAIPHPTPAERAERGKAARATAPRSEQGEYQPARDRRDPVALLEEQAASRVPALVPIRYGRMLVSPFTFYRGAAYPMAADLAGAPRTGLEVQLSGDAHLSNFAAFAASDRRLVFSINDFDETLPPVRMGREAPGRELRGGRPGPGVRHPAAAVDQPGGGTRVQGRDQGVRRDVQPRPLVLPHRHG